MNRVSEVYCKNFSNLVPYFLRDFFPLLGEFEFTSFSAGEIIYDFNEVPTTFYLIKAGIVKFEDQRFEAAKIPAMVRVKGEWLGFESFMCGAYAFMTREQLLDLSRRGETCVGNGFRATALVETEVVTGSLQTLFSYVSISELKSLWSAFTEKLYSRHPGQHLLMP